MKLNRCFSFLIALLALSAMGADFDLVIPAAGTGAGGFESVWATEVTLHNAGTDPLTVTLEFHASGGTLGTHTLTLAAKETKSLDDIVANQFGQLQATGAIVLDVEDSLISKLAVTSRTYHSSAAGEFGQDIPALPLSQAAIPGDTAVINGPSDTEDNRLNFGLYALEESEIEWRLLRRDGTVAATASRTYQAGTQIQYSSAIEAFFGVQPEDNDVIHAVFSSGRAFVYGSIVNSRTGDPTYVPAARTRENLSVVLLGVDLDENGTVDVADADGDGTLDQPLSIPAGRFPSFFRLVARDPENRTITFTLLNTPGDAALVDADGTIQLFPGADKLGQSEILIVRASDGVDATEFRIPLQYR